MGLPCKHMLAARRIKETSVFSELGVASRWCKQQLYQKHRIFQSPAVQESHVAVSLLKDRPLTNAEKFCRGNRLLQRLAELVADGGMSQYGSRMKLLEDLTNIWSANREARVIAVDFNYDQSTSSTKEVVNIPAAEKLLDDIDFTKVNTLISKVDSVDRSSLLINQVREEFNENTNQVMTTQLEKEFNENTQVMTTQLEYGNDHPKNNTLEVPSTSNEVNIKKLKFPSAVLCRGRPKLKVKKNAIGLRILQKNHCVPFQMKSIPEKVEISHSEEETPKGLLVVKFTKLFLERCLLKAPPFLWP
nr:uncharacterized protein LOC124817983 [Hydra vulgaris]